MKYTGTAILCACALIMAAAGCGLSTGAREGRYMVTGRRYMERRDYARAVLDFRNATKAAPNSADAHYQLGLALLAAGDARSGVQHLMKCTELNPRHAAAQAKLAQLMATSRDPEVLAEAHKRAQAAIEADPDAAAALDAMAMVDWNREQPEISEKHLEQALQKVPGHLKSATMLANIKIATKDYTGAEEVLRNAAAGNPQAAELRVAFGSLYRFLKRPNEAEEQFQLALKIRPDYAPVLLELARLRVQEMPGDVVPGAIKPEASAVASPTATAISRAGMNRRETIIFPASRGSGEQRRLAAAPTHAHFDCSIYAPVFLYFFTCKRAGLPDSPKEPTGFIRLA